MPGEKVRLVGEHRFSGERKYYLSILPAGLAVEEQRGCTLDSFRSIGNEEYVGGKAKSRATHKPAVVALVGA